MIKYPHIATVTYSGEATIADNGDLVPAIGGTPNFACRVEPATGDRVIISDGGVRVDYSWMVYAPVGTVEVAAGSAITVTQSTGAEVMSDTVKRFSRGQGGVRMWC